MTHKAEGQIVSPLAWPGYVTAAAVHATVERYTTLKDELQDPVSSLACPFTFSQKSWFLMNINASLNILGAKMNKVNYHTKLLPVIPQ